MARSLNIVIGADIDKLRTGLKDAVTAMQKGGTQITEETQKSVNKIEAKLASLATKNPTAGTVRQLTNLAMETRALGPEFQEMASQIIREAGKIKDSIGDARAEVGYFASDTRRLDAVIGGVQALAGAYAVVEGATALMGVENENLQKSLVKLQAVMAVVTGLQEVTNLLQTESAAIQGVLALRSSVATAAQTAYNSAVAGAVGVQRVFNLVMAAAPWALAITAIGAVVVAINNYAQKTRKAAEEQRLFNELNEATQKNFKDEVESVSGLLAIVNSHSASMRERKAALEEIQKIYPDFLNNQSLDKVNSEQLKTATNQLTNEIFKQAKAKAAFAKLQELSTKLLDLEIGKQQAQISQQTKLNELYASGATASQIQGFIESQKGLADISEKQRQQIQGQIDAIIKLGTAQNLNLTPTTQTTEAVEKQTIAVKELVKAQKQLDVSGIKPSELFATPKAPTLTGFKGYNASDGSAVKKNLEEQITVMSDYEQRMTASMQQVNDAFNSLAADGVTALGEAIGDILSGGANSFQEFGKKLLQAVAQFMRAFGSALITTAIASDVFKKFILKKPEVAIAAGVALVAGSAAIVGMLNKGPKATAFADGGIVSGPTLGLVGEYPNARNNPEVIAPLDKLKGMLKTGDNTSGFVASTTIQGRDLALIIERYNKDSKRG